MPERRRYFLDHQDAVRMLLRYEPRGHAAIVQLPTRSDADLGVLYIEVSGALPMCGHSTIGVATVLVETGMVAVTEPVTTVRPDTSTGPVSVDIQVEDGAATGSPSPTCQPSAPVTTVKADVPGHGIVHDDLSLGGSFCAMLPPAGLGYPFGRSPCGRVPPHAWRSCPTAAGCP